MGRAPMMRGGRLFLINQMRLHGLQCWPTLFVPFRAEIPHSVIDLHREPLQASKLLLTTGWQI